MNETVKRAFRVFLKLSELDQDALIAEISRYKRARPTEQRQIREDFNDNIITKVATGPYAEVCPYCGK